MKKLPLFVLFIFITFSNVFAQSEDLGKTHYDNGQVRYKANINAKGEIVGEFTAYYENGQLKFEGYLNDKGKPIRRTKFYFDNGQLEIDATFDEQGKPIGKHQAYYSDGKLRSEVSYNAKGIGKIKNYYENGQLELDGYVNSENIFVGEFKNYHENGQLYTDRTYNDDGESIGTVTTYHENGVVKIEAHYEDGVMVGSAEYDESGKEIEESYDDELSDIALNENEINTDKPKIFTNVEQMPEFPGGVTQMNLFLTQNLQYPAEAKLDGVEGRIVVRIVVTEDGSVTKPEILKRFRPDCDKEAIRILQSMPKWQAGKQNGKAVPVYYTFPIVFKLN